MYYDPSGYNHGNKEEALSDDVLVVRGGQSTSEPFKNERLSGTAI